MSFAWIRLLLRGASIGLCIVAALFSAAWANLAIWYQLPGAGTVRVGTCLLFDLVALAAMAGVISPRFRSSLPVYVASFVILLVWWGMIHPSNDKDWAPEVAHGLTGSLDGDRLTAQNVRNFIWRGETEFTEQWERRTYDLGALQSLDLYLVYWMGPSVAHTIVSFGFQDGRYLDFSIELRRTRNGEYSAIAGFFKTSELIYVGADERDLLSLRKARHEDVRLYRLGLPPDRVRALLIQYIGEANDLAGHPRFYNTLTTNCTTTIFDIARAVTPSIPFDWRVMLTGYLPSYLYERGAVDTSISLDELSRRADINSRIDAGLGETEFSSFLRKDLPEPR
jgi:hypothetical protein